MARLKLTFLGTRGGIILRSPRHLRHSSLLVESERTRVMIDCGSDWLHQLNSLAPTAIVLTHAHPDHAGGLAAGAPCPVYATSETWAALGRFPVEAKRTIPPGNPLLIDHLTFQAFPVEHSLLAPAVGLRICAEGSCIFYAPDVAEILDRRGALSGVDLYIGDGATVRRSMVRRRNGALIGHASIAAQLGWCKDAAVRQAIFTHCGSQIVRDKSQEMETLVRRLGREHGVAARIAYDGLQLSIGGKPSAGTLSV
ncbi:MAG TPA: MBL fold metallo-hydrolase [Hyphomicrobiaceae bacterium]